MLFFYVVPPPRVNVSISTGRFISESIVVLLCTINLPSTVNNGETIATTWFAPSGQLTNSSAVTISYARAISAGVFQSSVTINNFAPAVYNGEYICNATVTSSSPYIIGNSATGRRSVMISGS